MVPGGPFTSPANTPLAVPPTTPATHNAVAAITRLIPIRPASRSFAPKPAQIGPYARARNLVNGSCTASLAPVGDPAEGAREALGAQLEAAAPIGAHDVQG